ncbi:MAG: hypothetical protein FWC36_02245, partial [Spirochaetes bacterium]|nr:hypothetical protein [Spirochaetota bacterium]
HRLERCGNMFYQYDLNGNLVLEREGGHPPISERDMPYVYCSFRKVNTNLLEKSPKIKVQEPHRVGFKHDFVLIFIKIYTILLTTYI